MKNQGWKWERRRTAATWWLSGVFPLWILLLCLSDSVWAYDQHLAVSVNQQAASSRYRNVGLNGRPLADEKPQAHSESDVTREQSYVDMFDLSFHHSTTDIYIPIAGSDLALEVRRNTSPELWYEHYGIRPAEMPDRPFGSGWTSNLSASIHFVRHTYHFPVAYVASSYEADYAYVTDVNGGVTRFLILINGGVETFVPLPGARDDQEGYLCTLTQSNGRYTFKRKFGTQIVYEMSGVSYDLRGDRAFQNGSLDEVSAWARVVSVADRTGIRLRYLYDRENTVVPSRITVDGSNQELLIQLNDNGLVTTITDPRGNVYHYAYDSRMTPPVDYFGNPIEYEIDAKRGKPGGSGGFVAGQQYCGTPVMNDASAQLPALIDIIAPLRPGQFTGPRRDPSTLVPAENWEIAQRIYEADKAPKSASRLSFSAATVSTSLIGGPLTQTLGAPEPYYTLRTVTMPATAAGTAVTAYTYESKTQSALVGVYTASYEVQVGRITNPLGQTWQLTFSDDFSDLTYLANYGYLIQPGHPRQVQQITGPDGLCNSSFLRHSSVGPVPNSNQTALIYHGHRANQVTDSMGNARMYQFTGNNIYPLSGFNAYYPNLQSFAPLRVPHMVYYDGLEITSFSGANVAVEDHVAAGDLDYFAFSQTNSYGKERYHFDIAAGFSVDEAVDMSGNTTVWNYADTWDRTSNYPPLTGGNYAFGYYADPTSQTNAMGFTKTYAYSPQQRLLSHTTDEEGRTTDYLFDSQGNRTSEVIHDPSSNTTQTTTFTYGTHGFMTGKVQHKNTGDPDWATDLTTTYTVGPNGYLESEIVSSGDLDLTTTSHYDANGNKTEVIDPMGRSTTFTYDARNQLVYVRYPDTTDSNGVAAVNEKVFSYDLAGRKVEELDENGVFTQYFYDGLGRLYQSIRLMFSGGDHLVRTFGYNAASSKTYETDGTRVTWFAYDGLQRLVSSTDPAGKLTSYEYSGDNAGGTIFNSSGFQPTQIIDKRGFITRMEYDKLYRKTRQAVEYMGGQYSQTLFGYDKVGRQIRVTDPVGKVTNQSFDVMDRPLQTLFSDGTSVLQAYTGTGLKWKTRDERGSETRVQYDSAGRPRFVSGPPVDDGSGTNLQSPVTESQYDLNSNVIATLDPLGNRWDFEYDERNRKVSALGPPVDDADAAAGTGLVRPQTDMFYDPVGNLTHTIDAKGNVTQVIYDDANRPIQKILPEVTLANGTTDSPKIDTYYDVYGNVTSVVDPNGNTTTNTYDLLNRLIHTEVAGVSMPTDFEYDENGNRTAVIDGNGHRTEFVYDGLGRNTEIKDAQNVSTLFIYDGLNKISRTAGGQTTEYGYDLRNRLTSVTYVGRTRDNRIYSYDPAGNLLSVNESGKAGVSDVTYSYDALGRILSETSAGEITKYRYDLAGNKVFANTPVGQNRNPLTNKYDALNRVIKITDGENRVTRFDYDLDNNLRVSHAANGDKSKSTYDALNRPVQKWVASGAAAGGQDVKFNYAYDLAGNVIQIAENYPRSTLKDRTIDNTYDSANRLLTERFATNVGRGNLDVITRTYAYDGASNRLFKQETNTLASGAATAYQTSYSYNRLNQLIAYSGGAPGSPAVTLTYDANGNRIKQKVTGVSGATRYNYDYENRLVSVNDAAGASYSYDYDYRTRRVRRVEPGKTTKVVFSGGLSALELEGSTGTVEVRFMRGPDMGGGVGGLLYNLRGGDASFAYNDSRGDVVLRKNSAAATTYLGAYDTFGKRTQEWGTTIERQKANTKEEDPTGLLNEGFRYRDLETGVFITRDPLGFVDGPNLYAYVRQNPWSTFDPEGLDDKKNGGNIFTQLGTATIQDAAWVSDTVNNMFYGSIGGAFQLAAVADVGMHSLTGDSEFTEQQIQNSPFSRGADAMANLHNLNEQSGVYRNTPMTAAAQNTASMVLPLFMGLIEAPTTSASMSRISAATEVSEATVAPKTGGTSVFYHGTGSYTAMEAVETQAINIERLSAHQVGKSFTPGLYTTTQETTAGYYADLLFGRGQAGGPAILKLEVPTSVFDDFAAARNISIETSVPRMPGQTETFIPMEHLSEFNTLPGLKFSIHE